MSRSLPGAAGALQPGDGLTDAAGAEQEFLTTRRARITPEQAGLRVYDSSRRVAGLHREEVATLTGISAEHYPAQEKRRTKAGRCRWSASDRGPR